MKPQSNPFLRSASLVASLAFGITHTAFAAGNVTWNDGATANWNVAGNWTADVGGTAPPAAGDSLIFATTSGVTTLNNDITALSIGGLTFNAGASPFVIGGNAITLGGNVTNNEGTNVQTLNFGIDLGTADRTFTTVAGGKLILGGALSRSAASDTAITTAGAGTLALTGTWNSTNVGIKIGGGGTVDLTGATITGRRLMVGSGAVTVGAGSTLVFTNQSASFGSNNAAESSLYTQTGGSMTLGTLTTSNGQQTNTTMNISDGTLTATTLQTSRGPTSTAANDSTTAATLINVSGTGLINTGAFNFGDSATGWYGYNKVTIGTGSGSTAELRATTALNWGNNSTNVRNNTVEVNGGLFSTVATTASNPASNAVLNIGNGGTLQARNASTNFLNGLDTFNIKDGGAKIDTQANNITIANNILNFSGATSDSLTKLGSGTLTLSATGNTYSGGTTISNGALSIATTDALPGWDTNGRYSVASGATLAVYNAVTDTNVTTMLGTTNFAAGSSIGFDTTTAGRIYSDTIANTAQGALGLTKLGANILTLSGNNSYTGATTVSAGVINIQHANALGTTAGSTTVASGAAIELQGGISYAAEALAIDGVGVNGSGPGGSGAATNNGALRNVAGSNTWNGNITVGSAAISRIGADVGSTLTIVGDVNLTGAAATSQTTLQGDGSIIVNGKISGTGQLTSSSTGNSGVRTLTNNANDYSSKTNLNGGRLRVGANGALGASNVVFNGGTISSDGSTARTIANALSVTGAIVLGNSTDNGKLTFTNASTLTTGARTWTVNSDAEFQMNIDHSTGTMTKEGAGNLFLTGGGSLARLDINNGTMTVSAGTYNLSNYFTISTLASGPASYVQSGGTVNLTNATNGAYIGNVASSTSNFTVSGGAFNVNNSEGLIMRNNGTATMTVSGAGQLSSTGTGGLSYQKSGSTGTFNLGDGTTFSGGTSINDGGTSGVFTASKVVRTAGTSANNIFNFNGGTLKASAATFTFADNANIAANVMAGGGIIDNNSFDITIGQNLLNGGGTDGGMVFKGSGTTALTGSNTYTGDTTVTAGTLKLGNGTANTSLADASTVTIAAGAKMELNFPTGPATSDTVKKLYLGSPAVQVPAGVYDASTPTYGVYFAGAGSLTVTDSPPVSGYASWAAAKGLDGTPGKANGPTDDPEYDGIENLLEYVLNGNPLASDMAILPTQSIVGTNFVFSFTRRIDSAADTTQSYESSTNLSDWTAIAPLPIPASTTPGTFGVITVGAVTGTPPNEVQAITITVPKGSNTKLFGRLNVTQ